LEWNGISSSTTFPIPRDELTMQLGTKKLGSGKVGKINSGELSAQRKWI